MKDWLSRLDWVALVPELWALAKEKRHRKWEKELDATIPSYSQKPSITQHGFPSLWPVLLLPGPHGSKEGREGDKLVAWPSSHLPFAVF